MGYATDILLHRAESSLYGELAMSCPSARVPLARPDREAQLEAVLRELERRFGPWMVYRLRDARPVVGERALSLGALSLDLATGIDGAPRGRITELLGPASSGKSTLAFQLLASAQRRGEFVTYIDTAHQANAEQMVCCGVSLSDLLLALPENPTEALEIAALLVQSGGLGCIVLGPTANIGSDPRPTWPSSQLATLNAILSAAPTAVVFVSDAGARSTSAALRHFASLRLGVSPLHPLLHSSGDLLGLRIRVQVLKNKLASPGREVELDLRRDRGIHREADLADLGGAAGVLRAETMGLRFGDHLLGRGRERAIAALEADPALAQELEMEIRRVLA